MGSCQSRRDHIVTTNAIINQLVKIRLTCEQQQMKGARDQKMQDGLLLEAMRKPVKNRSRTVEKAMIGRTVFTQNIRLIYKYIENEARKLLERRGIIETLDDHNTLLPSINVLVYCLLFLNEESLNHFYSLIQQRFPEFLFPSDNDIIYSLIRYHRHREYITFEMENEYIMQFAVQYGISVAKINQVGHCYQFGAGKISYQY